MFTSWSVLTMLHSALRLAAPGFAFGLAAAQLDSGELTYIRYDTQDPASSDVMAEFNATNYGFYITEVKGSADSTRGVGGLWLYTDSSGTNEMIKSKFINLLKSELDRALTGD